MYVGAKGYNTTRGGHASTYLGVMGYILLARLGKVLQVVPRAMEYTIIVQSTVIVQLREVLQVSRETRIQIGLGEGLQVSRNHGYNYNFEKSSRYL